MSCNLCLSQEAKSVWEFSDNFRMMKCKNCGFLYLFPQPKEATAKALYTEDYYLNLGVQYLKNDSKEIIDKKIEPIEKLLLKDIGYPEKNNNRLLEIGCASGLYLKAAQRLGWDVYGVEVSEFASKFARENLSLNVKTGKFEESDFPDEPFDFIVMIMLLEHLEDPKQVLTKINRLLKPGGKVFINTPNKHCLESIIFGKKWHEIFFPYHLCIFSPSTIRLLAKITGFEIEGLSTYRHLSNFINQTSDTKFSTTANKLMVNNDEYREFRKVFKVPYKFVTRIIDEKLLLGEQLKVALRKC